MAKPKIVLADKNIDYLMRIQMCFLENFFEKIDLEVITAQEYFNAFFSSPRNIDLLVIAEEFYEQNLQKHNIRCTCILSEHNAEEFRSKSNISVIFKYSNINDVFSNIIERSGDIINYENEEEKSTQIIVVTSAAGGTGKTTVAMGIAACLNSTNKNVLYINCEQLQSFSYLLKESECINDNNIYSELHTNSEEGYSILKPKIQSEEFDYIPPFKASLMSFGIHERIFENIAVSAMQSGNYQYIILDTDSVVGEEKASLIRIADKVIVVVKQNYYSLYATNKMLQNLDTSKSEKYIFICNDFNPYEENALILHNDEIDFIVHDYIEHINHYDQIGIRELANRCSMRKAAYLLSS